MTTLHLVDLITGNEISGLTITDTDTAESHVSACGGVSFTNLTGTDNFDISPGTGTDCVTAATYAYPANTGNPFPVGDQTLTIAIDPFLEDFLTAVPTVLLDAHSPNIGGAYTQLASDQNLAIAITGILNNQGGIPTLGALYDNAAAPPQADYSALTQVNGDAGWSDDTRICVRFDSATGNYYAVRLNPAGTIELVKRVGGVLTVLASAPFAMPDLSSTAINVGINVAGSNLTASVALATVLTASDGAITAAGTWAIHSIRNVGQPVHLHIIYAA